MPILGNIRTVGSKRDRRKTEAAPPPKEGALDIQQVTWNGLTWIDIPHPTATETQFLAEHFPFHPLDLDDTLSRIQRSKIDVYRDYLFIVLHVPMFSREDRVTVPSQISIFISKDYLVTLHSGDLKPLSKLFRDCQVNEESRQENMVSSGYLLYRVVDRLIDYCIPILNKVIANIERVEDSIFSPSRHEPIQELSELRRDIISFRRIAAPLRNVVASLERRTQPFVQQDLEAYWGDVNDHMDKIVESLDESKEIIEGLSETGATLSTHHTNEIMRVLTIISTIILPLTLLASIYGMNVRLPGGEAQYTWIALLSLMISVIVGMLLFFRHLKWI